MTFSIRRIVFTSLFFLFVSIICPVYATSYGTLQSRIDQNNKMINNANSLNAVARSSYADLSLNEFSETNYKKLSTNEQNIIKNLANTILENNTEYTDIEKLEKFYDFILDNFYYYETPQKISTLSANRKYDNPYYLYINEYQTYGKVRARSNGYAMTLLALARTQNIPARIVGGYYNKAVRDNYEEWGSNITKATVNHLWVEAYVDGSWKMFDPTADSYKRYDDETDSYIDDKVIQENANEEENTEQETENEEENTEIESNEETTLQEKMYFNPEVSILSKTHIAFSTYAGNNNIKYVYNTSERNRLLSFLNIKSNNTTNGKRINNSYNSNNSATWFTVNDNSSKTNGYGNVTELYWPTSKNLAGNLNLSGLSKLEKFRVKGNNIKSLTMTGMSSLKEIDVYNNEMNNIVITGSSKLENLRTESNPATYIKYEYTSSKRTAIVKAKSGGTVSVDYSRANGQNKHKLMAQPNSNYSFVGWYKAKKRVSTKKSYTIKTVQSFTYVAKFKKKPAKLYIKVSISKQKIYVYKKNKLVYKSHIVTGQKGLHNTPKGTFKIRGKARNIYLVGDDYRNFVNYWMPIYGDIGMHDASWRWSFGGTIYKYNGSHGCINLPYKTAKYIYNNAPVGSTVRVVK